MVGVEHLQTLRDLVESMEEIGFPKAKLMRHALTLLEHIAAERKESGH